MFRSFRSRAAVAVVSVLVVGLPLAGHASPAGAASDGCDGVNATDWFAFGPVSAAAILDTIAFDAGDQVTGQATDPSTGTPGTVTLTLNVDVGSTPFPGSVEYTIPSPGMYSVAITVDAGEATLSVSCVPAAVPAPPPPYTGGPLGNCVSTLTAPTAPSALVINNQAVVSWGPSTSDPTGCVAGYVITPHIGTTAQTPILISGHGTTNVVSGLTNGQTYTFTVAAENGIDTGPASAATAPVTIGAPAAASAVRAARVARGAVKVAFKAASNGGAPITRYVSTCTSTNGGVTRSKAGTASPITVTGLTKSKTYRCAVSASNSRGTGPTSRPSATTRV